MTMRSTARGLDLVAMFLLVATLAGCTYGVPAMGPVAYFILSLVFGIAGLDSCRRTNWESEYAVVKATVAPDRVECSFGMPVLSAPMQEQMKAAKADAAWAREELRVSTAISQKKAAEYAKQMAKTMAKAETMKAKAEDEALDVLVDPSSKALKDTLEDLLYGPSIDRVVWMISKRHDIATRNEATTVVGDAR